MQISDLVASTEPVIIFMKCSRCLERFLKRENHPVLTRPHTHICKLLSSALLCNQQKQEGGKSDYLTYFQGQVTQFTTV